MAAEKPGPKGLAESVGELTDVTEQVARRLRQRTWWLVATLLAVVLAGAAGLLYQSTERTRLHRLVDNDCSFFADLGTLPVQASSAPALHRIVDDARRAYHARCLGVGEPLPPVVTLTPTPTR